MNSVSGPHASVSGGIRNVASGTDASASGGFSNTASGNTSWIAGGDGNFATTDFASVSGGAVATGLNAGCEGSDLHVRLSYRLTTDDCPEGSCTTGDINDLDLEANGAFCIVTNGKCKINTTLSTAAPGLFGPAGKNGGIEILGCGLHPFGMAPTPDSVRCGLLFP